jgi:hypothetical protein
MSPCDWSWTWIRAASTQGGRSLLAEKRAEKRKAPKNNQAAQAIDQFKFFSEGINQGQAGEQRILARLAGKESTAIYRR